MKNFKLMRIFSILVLISILLPIGAVSYASIHSGHSYSFSNDKNVLMISSYSPDYATFFDQVEGVKSVLDSYNIQLDVEFMDTKRSHTKENLDHYHDALSCKLDSVEGYDSVIVADDNALDFFLQNREELFNGIPMVFFGINNEEKAIAASVHSQTTGVVEASSIEETIEIANVLMPDAKRVVAIVDSTPSGRADLETYRAITSDLELVSIDSSRFDFGQLERRLSSLNQNDIVLLLSLYTNKDNDKISFNDGMNFIVNNCPAPVFHPYHNGIGKGLAGGKVMSHYDQGVEAGKLTLRILSGESPDEMPVSSDSPNKHYFDYEVMKNFNIVTGLIPDDAILLNKERNMFEEYWHFILIFSIIIFLESAMILKLRNSIKQNNMSESKLLKNNAQLEKTSAQLIFKNSELAKANKNLMDKEQQINELIYIDNLTGLNNRNRIAMDLEEKMYSNKTGDLVAVIFIDIDNFKNINDSYGHDMGDRVIKSHAKKLMNMVKEDATISRFGGDEFLIALNKQKSISDIEKFANRIVSEFAEPIFIENRSFNMTISMGISVYPNDGATVNELIKNADLALYHSKNNGKNKFTFFADQLKFDFEEKIAFQSKIKDALAKKEFFLNFQPQFSLSSGKLTGFEALIRWMDEEGRNISPLKLVSNAEEMGVILEIDRWVLSKACAFSKEINQNRENKTVVSVNISPEELNDAQFYEKTIEIIEKSGVDPKTICMELTETKAIQFFHSGRSVLQKLKKYGIKIALDDFGTGYSSLKYFNELPIDIVKIDKSFIDRIHASEYKMGLIESIVSIAHNRGLKVIAEGVESELQLEFLKRKSCDMVQGYIFGKPLDKGSAKLLL